MNLTFVYSGHMHSLVFKQTDSQETNTCKIDFYSEATAHVEIGVRVRAREEWFLENVDFYKKKEIAVLQVIIESYSVD